MSLFHIFFLAFIQGFTEFLPISSSAHLILPSTVLGWPDQGLAFDVAVHVGTLLAVVWYFRQDIVRVIRGTLGSLVRRELDADGRLGLQIVLATVPAGLIGILLESFIEQHLRSGLVIAVATIVFGLALGWADRRGSEKLPMSQLGWRAALLIGLSQALALIPGTSRSGITMTTALLLGFQRQAAARFSFLLSIPLIAAAGLLKTLELLQAGSDAHWGQVGLGALLSFVSAVLCIHFFLRYLDRFGFMPYVVYRLLLGGVLLVVLL